jgi:hypothetical protein
MPKRKYNNYTNEGVYLLNLLLTKVGNAAFVSFGFVFYDNKLLIYYYEVDGSAIGLIPTPDRENQIYGCCIYFLD